MQVSDNDGTGHPARHGFAKCECCYRWRRVEGLERLENGQRQCADREWCRYELALDVWANRRRARMGWDANGAPTGVDANGDAT